MVSRSRDWRVLWSVLRVPSGSSGPPLADPGPLGGCRRATHSSRVHSHRGLGRRADCPSSRPSVTQSDGRGALGACASASCALSLRSLLPESPVLSGTCSPLCFGFLLGSKTIVSAPALADFTAGKGFQCPILPLSFPPGSFSRQPEHLHFLPRRLRSSQVTA